ncbi:tail fiber domain-containing protein [Paracoccus denitrificans]|jgi:hypothetical protein|uniref:Metallophosphoesterase n=1 Tax=Paracoccus denitrificans (strain Pd 1222) TaxID=318586 RepID=A1B9G1_PARDP|nr:tail fiber domain-containing protein [Paracoccus denitrificans]ABL72155.1 metallophosphoesterase [Paracoccus denitrificans PD1222]MBB4625930.1 hypothetical protein [Paracoccus denitrificans]MCU7426908.1 tail fiber domain-containing protein [Paracoccus denitrificans]QAR28730.1 hypothetical protein EO213_20835 [Paracoccus denitrificans]UPV96875.1 tail fiber domain-containing protein [Paracoccus denitrificans]
MTAINRTIIVQADSRYLTQRVIEALDGYDDVAQAAEDAQEAAAAAQDAAQQAADAAVDAQQAASAAQEVIDDINTLTEEIENVKRAETEKWLFTADWQLRLDDGAVPPNFYPPEEEARRRQFLRDQIAKIEPGVDLAFYNGDLVDRPHLKTTGAASHYGFKEFREDIYATGISMDRWFFLPGNHESDHVTGDIPTRATTEEYQRWIGATDYYIVKGNMAHVFVGDGAGYGASQEIMTQTLAWLDTTLDSLRGLNIWLHFHAPMYGAHPNVTSDNSTYGIIHGVARLQPILSKYTDHIVCATYGHVSNVPPGSVWDTEVGGIRWINITTFIQAAAEEETPDLSLYHFNYIDLIRGTQTAVLRRMRLDGSGEDLAYRATLALPYPADLGGLAPSFDGRRAAQNSRPLFRGPVRAFVDAGWEENRENVGGDPSWRPRYGDYYEAFQVYVSETGNDPFPAGMLGGIGFYLNTQATQSDDQSGFITASTPVKRKAWFGGRQVSGSDDRGQAVLAVSKADGSMEEVARFSASDVGASQAGLILQTGGLHVPAGKVGIGAGATLGDLLTAGVSGVIAYDGGLMRARRDALMHQYCRDGEGVIVAFQQGAGNTQVGSISVTTSATSYNTSSDGRLKTDLQEFDGLGTINALEVWDYEWVNGSGRGRGVIAQDAALIAPYALTPGETPDEMWSADYSKFVPDLIRAVQQLSAKVAALESQQSGGE